MNNTKVNVKSKILADEATKLKEYGLIYREITSMLGVSKQWIYCIIK